MMNGKGYILGPVVINLPILVSVLSVFIQEKLSVLNLRQLTSLSSVSENVFSDFNKFLSSALPKLPKLRCLTLCSHNSSNSLPQCSNEQLQLLGKHCPLLEFLDVSFNKNITGDGIKFLVPNPDNEGSLKKVKIYEKVYFRPFRHN